MKPVPLLLALLLLAATGAVVLWLASPGDDRERLANAPRWIRVEDAQVPASTPLEGGSAGGALVRAAVDAQRAPQAADAPRERASIEGRLLDSAGAPIASHAVWLRAAREGDPAPADLASSAEVVAQQRTDAQGRFRFDGVASGAWWVASAAWNDYRRSPYLPRAARVEVDRQAVAAGVELRVARTRPLAGRGGDARGSQLVCARVRAVPLAGGAPAEELTDGWGRFRFDELLEGSYRVVAFGNGWDQASSLPQVVAAGEEHLALELRSGGGIEGVVIDRSNGAHVEASVAVVPLDGGDGPPRPSLTRDGGFLAVGVAPGVYAASARTADGRAGVFAPIAVQAEEIGEIAIVLAPGARLRLSSRAPIAVEGWSGGAFVFARALGPGEVAEEVVPAATVELRVREGASLRVVATAAPREGETLEVALGER